MKNRRNIFATVRWRHTEQGIDLSWPLLHFLSDAARTCIFGAIAIWLSCVALVAYGKETSLLDAAATINSLASPLILFVVVVIVVSLSFVILILDFVLLKRLRIDSETVALLQPWGTTRSWPRSSLVGVHFEVNRLEGLDDEGGSEHSLVELILHDGSSRERVKIGGTMSPTVAKVLAKQIGKYTRNANRAKSLRQRSR